MARKQEAAGTARLWCYLCTRYVEGRKMSGGYYCPSCSAYLQLKNQPPRSSLPDIATPAVTRSSKSGSGGMSGAKAGGSRG